MWWEAKRGGQIGRVSGVEQLTHSMPLPVPIQRTSLMTSISPPHTQQQLSPSWGANDRLIGHSSSLSCCPHCPCCRTADDQPGWPGGRLTHCAVGCVVRWWPCAGDGSQVWNRHQCSHCQCETLLGRGGSCHVTGFKRVQHVRILGACMCLASTAVAGVAAGCQRQRMSALIGVRQPYGGWASGAVLPH